MPGPHPLPWPLLPWLSSPSVGGRCWDPQALSLSSEVTGRAIHEPGTERHRVPRPRQYRVPARAWGCSPVADVIVTVRSAVRCLSADDGRRLAKSRESDGRRGSACGRRAKGPLPSSRALARIRTLLPTDHSSRGWRAAPWEGGPGGLPRGGATEGLSCRLSLRPSGSVAVSAFRLGPESA